MRAGFTWVALALGALCVVAYGNTLDGGWVWDDASSVLLHRHVQDPAQFFQLFREDQHAFGRGQGNFYRPLVSASFMADFALAYDAERDGLQADGTPRVSPTFFHISNLLWHAAAVILFALLLAQLGAPRAVQLAVGGIYAVHPLHTEAVAYISGRADMMAAAFMFAGMACALAARGTLLRQIAGWTGAVLFGLCALLSKESGMIYPLLLAGVLLVQQAQTPREDASITRRLLPFAPLAGALLVLVGYGILRTTVLSFAAPADDAVTLPTPLGTRILEAGQAMGTYLQLLVWPTHLHMERTLDGVPVAMAALGYGALLLMAGGIAVALRLRYWRIALGLVWFIITWLPISGLFPLNAPMAEHWLYVPMAGLWWAVAECCWLLAQQRPALARVLVPLTAVFVFGLLGATLARNNVWHDNETLFRATLAENPNSARVHYNLAVTYDDLQNNAPGAVRHYREVLRLQGDRMAALDKVELELALADNLMQLGRPQEAATQLQEVLQYQKNEALAPAVTEAAYRLGRSLLILGDFGNANRFFQLAIARNPAYGPQVENLLAGATR